MNTPDLDKPLINAVGISKDYVIGDNVVHALSDVHFSIFKGELVAIMGPWIRQDHDDEPAWLLG